MSARRWLAIPLALLLLAPGVLPGGAPGAARAASSDFGYGFNVVDWGTAPDQPLALARSAGFGWVKGYVRWRDAEPANDSYFWGHVDNMLNGAAAYGLKVLLRVDEPPGWASGGTGKPYATNPDHLRSFMQALAAHAGSRAAAYEIFNEPNLASDWAWGASPNPAAYVDLLRAAYNGVKAGNPAALVVSAGLASNAGPPSMNDLDYLRGMYAAGAKDAFDALGSHPYGGNTPPETDPKSCGGICFRRAELQRQIMEANGDGGKKVWATEFGYLLTSGYDLGGYNWMKVSAQQQADYLVRAFDYAYRTWDWAGPFFVFNLDYSAALWCGGNCYPSTSAIYWFSVLNEDRSPRPAYSALKSMAKFQPPTPTISASPTSFVLGPGLACSSRITWNTDTATAGQVWLAVNNGSETLFAQGVSGSAPALIQAPGSYSFRLYEGTSHARQLASASVTAQSVSPSPSFCDVPPSDWGYSPVQTVYQRGITSGCAANGSTGERWYCPNAGVTRAQMAVFLLKAKHGGAYSPPPAKGNVFQDVPAGYWAAPWIEQLYREGITGGCQVSPPLYCPEATVTRAQMAIFLLKTKHGASYVPPAAGGIFADVPTTYWAAAWIEELYRRGITGGCATSPLRYCPESPNSRREMAVFLVRTFP